MDTRTGKVLESHWDVLPLGVPMVVLVVPMVSESSVNAQYGGLDMNTEKVTGGHWYMLSIRVLMGVLANGSPHGLDIHCQCVEGWTGHTCRKGKGESLEYVITLCANVGICKC